MINRLSTKEIQDFINNHLDIELILSSKGYYWQLTSPVFDGIITWSKNLLIYPEKPLVSFGLPIAEILNSKLRLLPPILGILENLPIIQLPWNAVQVLTRGKPAKAPMLTEKLYLAINAWNQTTALVRVTNQRLFPIVDMGYYLRSENKATNR